MGAAKIENVTKMQPGDGVLLFGEVLFAEPRRRHPPHAGDTGDSPVPGFRPRKRRAAALGERRFSQLR